MKKRGFGVNLYNGKYEANAAYMSLYRLDSVGFGGKVEPGESVYQAAVRELEVIYVKTACCKRQLSLCNHFAGGSYDPCKVAEKTCYQCIHLWKWSSSGCGSYILCDGIWGKASRVGSKQCRTTNGLILTCDVEYRTEEMRPEWFDYDSIPHEQMWPDARVWFQHMLKKQPFLGEYHFSEV